MSIRAHLERELLALLAAAGHEPGAGDRLRLRAGTLEIDLRLTPAAIAVDLSGWRQTFELGDDDDGADAAALALDLIGGALFGALRVVVEAHGDRPCRFTLELARGERWDPLSTQGSRPWNPLARLQRSVHCGAAPRPPRYAARTLAPPPWAPWAGACGFHGAPDEGPQSGQATQLPITGELDLHNFHPREIKPLVLAYIDECLARGLVELRIVHGKGIGNLRRTVHALLERHPRVKGFRLAGHGGGGWGATLVDLSSGPGARIVGEDDPV
ncbi:Smr/MutS family protein [Nannocystis sp.]|uniref:Smr/MutS family protein n=1 Tax=Nannocystis sp. TaxID=1962667 RepID=UPI0025E5889E|nr:Smr/MutS family protein [Nannocystis sp.]MBK7829476.1 Smr/MutS family protein [Nannocystis sp.]